MPINSSGPVSIGGSTIGQSLNLEFGRTATQTTSMSQLYRGGGVVVNTPTNANIPTSGAISLSNFYSASGRVTINLTISSNVNNYDVFANRGGTYVAGFTDLTLTINSGVVVGASSTSAYALTVSGFTTGDTVSIINNGRITGAGGTGGNSGYGAPGTVGQNGGPAIYLSYATTITNNSIIYGGGGGGGGGGGLRNKYDNSVYPGGIGGGGAGQVIGVYGSGFIGDPGTYAPPTNGTLTSGGQGGSGQIIAFSPNGATIGGIGANAGNPGSQGGNGGTSSDYASGDSYYTYVGGSGGLAGYYIIGNAYATWAVIGTRGGRVS